MGIETDHGQHATTTSSSKASKSAILYAGEECVLGGILVTVTGSAGGSIDNTTETATFNSTTLQRDQNRTESARQRKSNGTALFPTEAFEWHREQALSVS